MKKKIYEGCTIYKIYHKKEDRFYAVIIKPDGSRTTTSWARYIMTTHLNRQLDKVKETVDHIDGNKTNDDISNLQLLHIRDNIKKSAKGERKINLVCPVCKKKFTALYRQTHFTKGGTATCCSRRCGGIKSHWK